MTEWIISDCDYLFFLHSRLNSINVLIFAYVDKNCLGHERTSEVAKSTMSSRSAGSFVCIAKKQEIIMLDGMTYVLDTQ